MVWSLILHLSSGCGQAKVKLHTSAYCVKLPPGVQFRAKFRATHSAHFGSGIGYDFPGTVEHEYIYLSFQFQMKIYTNSKWLLRNIFFRLLI